MPREERSNFAMFVPIRTRTKQRIATRANCDYWNIGNDAKPQEARNGRTTVPGTGAHVVMPWRLNHCAGCARPVLVRLPDASLAMSGRLPTAAPDVPGVSHRGATADCGACRRPTAWPPATMTAGGRGGQISERRRDRTARVGRNTRMGTTPK